MKLRLQGLFVGHDEFQELRHLYHVHAGESDAMRVGALDDRQVAKHL